MMKRAFFEVYWISMEFDIVRYVLIFLTYFGHNLGTTQSQTDSS